MMPALRIRAPRYSLGCLSVVYDSQEKFCSGPVINISATGMVIETSEDLTPGTKVTLLPEGYEDDSRLPFEIRAVVVRPSGETSQTQPGLALRFEGLTPSQSALLQHFLRDKQFRSEVAA
jgi:hypothetical protein